MADSFGSLLCRHVIILSFLFTLVKVNLHSCEKPCHQWT